MVTLLLGGSMAGQADPRITTALERIKRFDKLSQAYQYKQALVGRKVPPVVTEALVERIAQLRSEAAAAAVARAQLPLFD